MALPASALFLALLLVGCRVLRYLWREWKKVIRREAYRMHEDGELSWDEYMRVCDPDWSRP